MLETVVYESTSTGSTASLLTLATLLAESQRNNVRDGLTGALAAHGGRFFQAIEGQGQVLDGLLRRLARDPRHTGIRILGRWPIDERVFSGWSMANAVIAPRQGVELDQLMADAEPSAVRVVALLRAALAKAPQAA